ncbi:MAG TPA: DNA polymerase IV [Candidatus Norongarragalinales archaeon]|nr:DNA polymerase IV [Candidatus Norongarragalinales archaeon]
MTNTQRIVFLVDLDYFYAAVEERENPELKGKPVIVGMGPMAHINRGVVSTCNYEARKFGVHSAMPLAVALKKCPDCIVLQPRMSLYSEASDDVMKILQKHAVAFEQVSIDEAFMEMTGKVHDFKEAEKLALKIQQQVLKETKLPCSIGIGPNKLVAKMSAGEHKPFGVTVVTPKKVHAFLWPKQVDELYGVGPKTTEKLKEYGVKTIGDLAKQNRVKLVEDFGKYGAYLADASQGKDDSSIGGEYEAKSVGRLRTFDKDTSNVHEIISKLDELADDIAEEVQASNYEFKTVTVTARYSDFSTRDHSKTIPATNDAQKLKNAAHELLQNLLAEKHVLRRIGLRVSNLENVAGQKKLFEYK